MLYLNQKKKSEKNILIVFGILSWLVIIGLFYIINQNQKNSEGLLSQIKNLRDENTQLQSQMNILNNQNEDLKQQIQILNNKSQENFKECVSYLSTHNYGFPKGEITVGFISILETEQVIKDIGLEKKEGNLKWAVLKVPIGTEIEWVCKLKSNPYLEYAELNVIVST